MNTHALHVPTVKSLSQPVGIIDVVIGQLDSMAPCQYIYKYEKHFQKMYRDVGMVVPKTTETRCRDGSVQARQVIQRLHN